MLLAFENFKMLPGNRMLQEDPSLVHYPVQYDALVFAPLPGERITATLSHVLQNTVFLNLLDLFIVQIPLHP